MLSASTIAIYALLALGILKVLITFIQRARGPLAHFPGPWYSLYTSKILLFYWIRGERASYVERLHQIYGPVVRLSPSEADFSSISGAKTVHRYRQPFLKSEFYTLLVTGKIVNTDNVFSTRDVVFHAQHRRLLSGPMSKSSLKSVEPIVKSKVELAMQQMAREMKSRGCADIAKWWLFMATDVIGELSFGDSFRTLEIGKKSQYAEDLDKVASLSGLRVSFPTIVKLASMLPFKVPLFREAADSSIRMEQYSAQSLQRHRDLVKADPNAKPTLFKKLYEPGKEGLSPREIVAEARAYIIAGSDTTANSLTYLVWAVCKDSAIKQRLVEEVATLPEDCSEEDLEKLPYLANVIQETLRLYGAAPGALPRSVPKEGCEIDGYWTPGGITVTTQAWSMHRNKAVYSDPERFNPSRWENATKDMHDAWMPFGGGSRNCIGMHLATMELRLATARFFQTFPNARVSSREGFTDDQMVIKSYLLMFPKGKRCLIENS